MTMRYDVEADFYPLTTCNFRCSYCFLSPAALGARLQIHATNEEWQSGFNATGKTWLLHVTGGEPFLYPGFVDLCERLSAGHYLSINTNLSHRSVAEFACRVDPARVHSVQQNVRFLTGPAQCDANYCPYFCEKYTSLPYLTVPESVEVSTATL